MLLRHLVAHPAGGVSVALLVLLITVIATAAPRAVDELHTRSLGYALSQLPAVQRDIDTGAVGVPELGPGSGPSMLDPEAAAVWGAVDGQFLGIRAGMPSPLRQATERPEYLLAADGLAVRYGGQGNHTKLSLAFDPAASTHVRYVDGAAPSATTDGVIEVGLARANADAMEWTVGDTRTVEDGQHAPIIARLSGVFEPTEPDDGYWSHATLLTEPSILDDGLGPPIYTGTGLVAPSVVASFGGLSVASRLSAWFPLIPAAVTNGNAAQILEQLHRFEVSRTGISFTAGAADTIEATIDQSSAVDAVIAMTASGPVGVMIAVLLLGCRIIARRRTEALRLLTARGASATTVRGLLAVEGLVVGIPAGVIGTLVGLAITSGPVEVALLLLPASAALLPAILLGAHPVDAGRASRSDLDRAQGGRVRLVGEIVVVGLAAVATFALIERGSITGARTGVDPLLAAVPLLLALAACVGALRLYPLPLAAVVRLARGRRGLGGFLGPVRALRDPAAGLAPVLALVVGVAVAVSSAVLLTTISTGTESAATTAVGADMRVSGASLTGEQVSAIADVPGVAAIAAASSPESVPIDANGRRTNTSIIVVDTAALARVQAGQPGAFPVTDALRRDDAAIPVIASASTASAIDDTDAATLGDEPITVVATLDGPTALSSRSNWLIVDSRFADRAGVSPVTRTVLMRLEPQADPAAVTSAVERIGSASGVSLIVDTPQQVASAALSSPTTTGLRTALLIAIAVTGLLSALTIAMTLVLGGPDRSRILTLLRMLGGGRREAVAIGAWEIAPPAAVALVVGAVLGVALPLVVLAGVDLRGFTGGRIQPALAIDAAPTLALVLGFVVVTALFTFIALGASRRARAGTILRTVEEG